MFYYFIFKFVLVNFFLNSNGQNTTVAKEVCLKNVIFIADFAMVDCGENCLCKIEYDVTDIVPITNKSDSDYLNIFTRR